MFIIYVYLLLYITFFCIMLENAEIKSNKQTHKMDNGKGGVVSENERLRVWFSVSGICVTLVRRCGAIVGVYWRGRLG